MSKPDRGALLDRERRLDELYTAHPFLGSRRMTAMLRQEGRTINRKRVQRLMRLMRIEALGRAPASRPRVTRSTRIYCAT